MNPSEKHTPYPVAVVLGFVSPTAAQIKTNDRTAAATTATGHPDTTVRRKRADPRTGRERRPPGDGRQRFSPSGGPGAASAE
ncbi:hypothetical protein ACWEK7_22835 [Streptomyces californicus]